MPNGIILTTTCLQFQGSLYTGKAVGLSIDRDPAVPRTRIRCSAGLARCVEPHCNPVPKSGDSAALETPIPIQREPDGGFARELLFQYGPLIEHLMDV